MIGNAANAGSYFRNAQTYQSKPTFTPTDTTAPTAATDEGTAGRHAKGAIPVSALRKLDTSGLMVVSLKDNPRIRDQIAMNWLDVQTDQQTARTEADNIQQNAYATVKVDGKVVATLYNGGSAEMTIDTMGKVGSLPDPGPDGGPNQAQARAEYIAKAVGGTIEASPTAITQSEWKLRPDASKGYSRADLDAAFQAMMTGASMPNRSSGHHADFSA